MMDHYSRIMYLSFHKRMRIHVPTFIEFDFAMASNLTTIIIIDLAAFTTHNTVLQFVSLLSKQTGNHSSLYVNACYSLFNYFVVFAIFSNATSLKSNIIFFLYQSSWGGMSNQMSHSLTYSHPGCEKLLGMAEGLEPELTGMWEEYIPLTKSIIDYVIHICKVTVKCTRKIYIM
jgi:hypothetical protein